MFTSPHPRRSHDSESPHEPVAADADPVLHLSHHEMHFLLRYRLADEAAQSHVDTLLLGPPCPDVID
jgi:hypothetical protein